MHLPGEKPSIYRLGIGLLLPLSLLISGCGGGDAPGEATYEGTEGPNSGVGSVWISSPSSNGSYTTAESTIRLKGGSFTPPGSTCPSVTGVLPPAFSVTWFNDLNGKSGAAFTSLSCATIVIASWDTGDYVPLEVGANTIHVTADDGAGNIGRDKIVVTRVLDVTPPTVVSVVPTDGSMGVGLGALPYVTFSESMNPGTITAATITLADGAGLVVPATVTYDDQYFRALLTTTTQLSPNTRYTLTVTTAVRDRTGGNPLAAAYVSSFTTGP
jgi:hypothetical protein